MNNDIVDRLRYVCSCESQGVCTWCDGADEIVRHRARVTELEAENAAFREQFATVDEVAALMAEHGGKLEDAPGWVKVHYPDWRALADQLAEALDDVLSSAPMTLGTIRDSWFYALAAYVAARRETP